MLKTVNDQHKENKMTKKLLNAYIREAQGEVNSALKKEVQNLEEALPESKRLEPTDSTFVSEMQFLRNLKELKNLGKKDDQEESPAKTPGMS